MLCNVCRVGLEGIWDPSKTPRVCTAEEWHQFNNHPQPPPDPRVFITQRIEIHDIDHPDAPEHFVFGHHVTRESFLQSIADGCVFCNRFKPMFGREEDQEPNDRIAKLGYYTLFKVTRKPATMYMFVGDRLGGFEMVEHHFGDEDVNLNISPYTGDEVTWRLIQQWLRRCVDTHGVCNEKPDSGYVPTRLVEFDHTSSTTPTFRVVPRNEIPGTVQYLTLSHCWGPEPQLLGENSRLKLTQETYARLARKQPVSELPKTFREAGEVVARLGFRYLWIDSLCIFQDTESDWRAQSTAMAEIYGNAYLNIAALGASGDEEGLFFSRDPAKVRTTVFDFEVDGLGLSKPYRFSLDKGWSWRLSFDGEPLAKRGWAVQERILSPRVLLFGSKQVFWECYDTICSETHPRTLDCSDKMIAAPESASQPPHHVWKDLIGAASRDLGPSVSDIQTLFTDWYSMQMLYSRCALTVPSDKLVALSGLAQDMKRHLTRLGCEDTRYLAGIWSARLPQALVWNVRDCGTRPAAYRAPSWSWAAVDTASTNTMINMHDWRPHPNRKLVAELVEARTDLLDLDNETGAVIGGVVKLRGKLFAAELLPRPYNKNEVVNEAESKIRNFRDIETDDIFFEVPNTRGSFWSVIFDTRDDVADKVLCLPVTWTESEFNGYARLHVGGLVLRRDDDGYRRVGCLSLQLLDDAISPFLEDVVEREVAII